MIMKSSCSLVIIARGGNIVGTIGRGIDLEQFADLK